MPAMRFAVASVVLLVVFVVAGGTRAQSGGRAIHPLYGSVDGAPRDDEARTLFTLATGRYRLGPVETMDVPGAPPPRAPALLKEGIAAAQKQQFADATLALDAAAAEVAQTGAAGLTTTELADLYLHQAMAAQRADWKDPPTPPTEITPPAARDAYLRAAMLTPERALLPRQFPPLVMACWRLAVDEIRQRPRGGLLVRAPVSAQIFIDGGPARLSPATAPDTVYGDHVIRVEDVGRQAWVTVATLAMPVLDVDAPEGVPYSLDDASVAAHARRMGAAFALFGQLKVGAPAQIEVRLIDAASGTRKDATTVPLADPAALEATVMRFDEDVRRQEVQGRRDPDAPAAALDLSLAVAPARPDPGMPSLRRDPAGWARGHAPLLTAIGVAVVSALVLGIWVAGDDRKTK